MKKLYTLTTILSLFLSICFVVEANAQGSNISGNLVSNNQFFVRDTAIGAANTPQYDRQLFGADAWFDLRYQDQKGLRAGLRFDMFLNSNLLNPTGSYNGQGIGRWFIQKTFGPLDIEVGNLYHQVGSGIIFRSYEQRALAIDNSLFGVRATYNFSEDLSVTGFAGKQKQQFEIYESNIRGAHIDGYTTLGDSTGNFSLAPGVGVVARTLDDNSMNLLVSTLNTYPAQDTFSPNYNTYAVSAYNTLTYGPISWYLEAAYKTAEAQTDPEGVFERIIDGEQVTTVGEKIYQDAGTVLYTSIGYAAKGLGLSAEYKRTENFFWRARPQANLNQGFIGFLPPMTRINTYRLTARYNAATQELAEQAFQFDAAYKINKKWRVSGNFSQIDRLNGENLWREEIGQVEYKHSRKLQVVTGLQAVQYDQELYETKPGAPTVKTFTPFAEVLYKFSRKRALRTELQVLNTKQDFGSWIFGLTEFTMAPHWTFTASDMYLFDPAKSGGQKTHYPRFDVFYAWKANRISASYIKQVEGVVCSGGICRLEPAFSGYRFSLFAQF
ncbi:MAG: DUF6029 family protein [Saprospiraceae bacterium]